MKQQLYMYVKEDLQKKIKEGVYLTGDKLPTETEMCEIYHVGKATVRQALNVLVNLGYVYSVKRVGYFVAQPKNDEYVVKFDELNVGSEPVQDVSVVEVTMVGASGLTGGDYDFPAGSKALKVCRVFSYLGMPVGYEEKFLLYSMGKRAVYEEKALFDGNSADLMSEYIMNYSIKRRISLKAAAAKGAAAQYLQVQEGYPLLLSKQVYLDRYDRPLGYCYNFYKHEFAKIRAHSYKPHM